MTSPIVVIGAGGHAISVTNVAISCGFSVIAFVDDNKVGTSIMGIPIINKQQCLNIYPDHQFVIAIGDNAVREIVYSEYKNFLPNANFPSLIHKSSIIGVFSSVGNGTVVMPLVNVGPNSTVGECCILNTGSSIDHDCNMSDFSSLAPGVVCGGTVDVGVRSAISIGATVKHGVKIGTDVVIGANSYLNKSMDDNFVAYGNPCKKIRTRKKGEAYLS